jgi:hypothetical protein
MIASVLVISDCVMMEVEAAAKHQAHIALTRSEFGDPLSAFCTLCDTVQIIEIFFVLYFKYVVRIWAGTQD